MFYIIKEVTAVVLFILLIAFLVFLGFTDTGRDVTDRSMEKISATYQATKDYVVEKASNIFRERKEIVKEEVEKEKTSLEEMIVTMKRGIFSRIGDLIFSLPFLSRE